MSLIRLPFQAINLIFHQQNAPYCCIQVPVLFCCRKKNGHLSIVWEIVHLPVGRNLFSETDVSFSYLCAIINQRHNPNCSLEGIWRDEIKGYPRGIYSRSILQKIWLWTKVIVKRNKNPNMFALPDDKFHTQIIVEKQLKIICGSKNKENVCKKLGLRVRVDRI
jgi:hypothetical protein